MAIALDPGYALAHAALADAYAFDVEDWKKAEIEASEAIRLDPGLGQPHATIGFVNARTSLYEAYTAKEMYPEAVGEYFRMEEANMTTMALPAHIQNLKTEFATGGIRAFWRARIEMLKKPIPNNAYSMARYHLRLGEHDEAMRWFRHAYENREFGFVFLHADPVHSELANDPRFRELVGLLLGRTDGKNIPQA